MICISESELYKDEELIVDHERRWTVYYHQNKVNGKIYVGITSQNPEERWKKDGCGYKDSPRFWNAICKYGWDNMYHEIFAKNLTSDEANKMEIRLIKELKTYDSQYGYNISLGGDGFTRRSAEHVYQYDNDGNFIKYWDSISDVAKLLSVPASHIRKCCNGKYHSILGYIFRYEPDDNLQPRHTYSREKSIIQYDMLGNFLNRYDNAYLAMKSIGHNHSDEILKCCDNVKKYCKDYIWFYEDSFDQKRLEQIVNEYKRSRKYHFKYSSLEQYDLNGNLIAKYKTFADVIEKFSLSDSEIRKIMGQLRGQYKSTGNCIWKAVPRQDQI